MQIVRDLAGYSLGRSDLMRRAMAKKKKDVMAKERENFIHGMVDENGNVLIDGCVRRGVSEEAAGRIYDEMSAFASYAFNKSHAAAYALVAVRTAWLKLRHPVPFMAALMNSMLDNTPKIAGYIQYCRQSGIPVLPPDVNQSVWKFRVDRDADGTPGIRFGLGGVKNVGQGVVRLMEKERKKGPFTDLFDFAERCGGEALNKRAVESLIKAGAFDSLPHNRNQLLRVFEGLLDDTAQKRRNNLAGQMSLFDLGIGPQEHGAQLYEVPDIPDYPQKLRLSMEREMTGVYITGHPLNEVASLLRGCTSVADTREMAESEDQSQSYDGLTVRMGGILTAAKGKITKKGSMMGTFTLEDLTGQIDGLAFPRVYERCSTLLNVDQMVLIEGKLSFREDEEPKLLADSVRPLADEAVRLKSAGDTLRELHPKPKEEKKPELTDAMAAKQAPKRIYLLAPNREYLFNVKVLCGCYPGEVPVYVKLEKEGIALLLAREQWCDAGPEILDEFYNTFGEDHVVIKEKEKE